MIDYYTERRQASAQSDGSAIASIMAVAVAVIFAGLVWNVVRPLVVGQSAGIRW